MVNVQAECPIDLDIRLTGKSMFPRRGMAVKHQTRYRLVRQLVTESCVLFLLGAGAGLVVSSWTTGAIRVRSRSRFR